MYASMLTLLALASKTAFALPAPAEQTAGVPLPAHTIFQLDDTLPNSWFENIAVRRNGDLLVTMLMPNASIYSISEPLSGSPKASITNIDGANGLLGITEISPDVFIVAGGQFSGIAEPVPGTMAVWEVDFRKEEPTTRLVAKMPEAGLLNGVATISRCSSAVLIADTGMSRVWRVDTVTGAYEIAVEVPEMLPLANATLQLGVNGVDVRDGYLYFDNSNRASIFRLPIDKRGMAVEGVEPELLTKLTHGKNMDDFLIDEEGRFWAATNSDNTVEVADGNSPSVVVLGSPSELTVAGDTALAFGRTKADKNIIYVVTGGAVANPVNGTLTEPAKVVAIDRTGF
ncbi:hypothetical protein F5B22DRAFT_119084 [Xylaria bambusicola]|uniref:uncharacterized protein n=1 Tax=Xylaria bambusicola TaxID=326684 RepID=UPI0020077F74|nr:uncharacterized protein F5B22DRAFT_119084 [Xylaria bambusicola]KAI0517341.1 hypothetical protein F5B22DRAFT_119084 [Xylaria bambusicola]